MISYRLTPGTLNYFFENLKILAKDQLLLPSLFLYSKNDHLVSYKSTQKFIEERKKFAPNLKIDTVVFEDSEHCMHYLKHKDVYLNKIKEHLKNCQLKIYEAKP